jgi:RNA polymerase primary sigma factor
MKAVTRYDPTRGCKFSTYATWWIRQAVTRSLSNYGRTVRIPVYVTDNVARYKKTAEDLYIRSGKRPDPEEVAEEMGIKVAEARRLREFVEDVSPLDNMDSTDLDEGRGVPESSELLRTDKAIVQFELDQQMEELMTQLTPREGNILRYRYGLMDGMAHTLEETGRQFSLTRERIRQIEKDAMKRLRGFVSEHLDDFKP